MEQECRAGRGAPLSDPRRFHYCDANAMCGKSFCDHRAGHAATDDRDVSLVMPVQERISRRRFGLSQPNCSASPQYRLAHRHGSCTRSARTKGNTNPVVLNRQSKVKS